MRKHTWPDKLSSKLSSKCQQIESQIESKLGVETSQDKFFNDKKYAPKKKIIHQENETKHSNSPRL